MDIIGVDHAFAELCVAPLQIFSFFPIPGEAPDTHYSQTHNLCTFTAFVCIKPLLQMHIWILPSEQLRHFTHAEMMVYDESQCYVIW